MSNAQILEFRRCVGCYETDDKLDALVALGGTVYICPDCVILAAGILANQARQETRISFVDGMMIQLKEPAEVVAKWKEIKDSTGGQS